jgi:hypothetical protein
MSPQAFNAKRHELSPSTVEGPSTFLAPIDERTGRVLRGRHRSSQDGRAAQRDGMGASGYGRDGGGRWCVFLTAHPLAGLRQGLNAVSVTDWRLIRACEHRVSDRRLRCGGPVRSRRLRSGTNGRGILTDGALGQLMSALALESPLMIEGLAP